MNKLLKEETITLNSTASGWRASDEDFIRIWQLADHIEDVTEKLNMCETARIQKKVLAWINEGTAQFVAFKTKGYIDGTEELSSWRGWGTKTLTYTERHENGQPMTDFLANMDASRIVDQQTCDIYVGEPQRAYLPGISFTLLKTFEDMVEELHEEIVRANKILLNDTYFSYYNEYTNAEALHHRREEKIECEHKLTLKGLDNRPDRTMAKLAAAILRRYQEYQEEQEKEAV